MGCRLRSGVNTTVSVSSVDRIFKWDFLFDSCTGITASLINCYYSIFPTSNVCRLCTEASLPFAALQLLAPPVRVVSAALWKVMKQRDVMQYGVLEEFVTSACETVPGLLTVRHQGKLALGLRGRVSITGEEKSLFWCVPLLRSSHSSDSQYTIFS